MQGFYAVTYGCDDVSRIERFAKKVPDPYILIIGLIALSSLATYVIPAGKYKRETTGGTETVIPGTFHQIPQQPVSIPDFFLAVQRGLIDAASIVFFVILVGGALGIIRHTGALEAALAKIVVRLDKYENGNLLLLVVPVLVGFMGGVIGSYEELIPFIPLMVMVALSLNYDAVVGCAIILLGARVGFATGPLNPFNVGVAQEIAGLPLFSGMWYRWIFWVILLSITIAYIYRYAAKVKEDPSRSYVSDIDYSDFELDTHPADIEFEQRHYYVLGLFLLAIIALVIGVIQFGWFINQIATLFLFTGIAIGLVYGMDSNSIVDQFIEGTSNIMYAALIIGFARGVVVVLRDGSILDTLIFALIQPLQQLPGPLAGALVVPLMSIVNFFIPSGSGQAAVVVPLLAPVADALSIPRQAIILAYQYGDGLTNTIIPTAGATMAMISLAEIPYGRWVAFAAKLVAIQLVVGMIAVTIAIIINLGPT